MDGQKLANINKIQPLKQVVDAKSLPIALPRPHSSLAAALSGSDDPS